MNRPGEVRAGEVRAEVPRTAEGVEAFCQQFRKWHAAECGQRDLFASELLLREALMNGVAHGAGRRTPLACVLRGGAKRLMIAVNDGGPGFDWRAQRHVVAATGATRGRGLEIYYGYASRVRFNTSGNGLTLVRVFGERAKEKAT